jgi:hypothetical protein
MRSLIRKCLSITRQKCRQEDRIKMVMRSNIIRDVGWVHYSGFGGNGIVSLRVSLEVLDILTSLRK